MTDRYCRRRARRELDACRERVLQLALAHPAVSFRVTNAPQRETLLSLPLARGPSLLPPLLLR
jgi:DNA mismatch repair ATPase MutL